jgi:hypothetical protein
MLACGTSVSESERINSPGGGVQDTTFFEISLSGPQQTQLKLVRGEIATARQVLRVQAKSLIPLY